jgi:sugar-specific transcriptional regulator TrmB
MYKDIFTQLGLSSNEAIVYEFLLKQGKTTAGAIIKKTPLKRGVVYNALADLSKKGLVSEGKKQKVAYFSPNHPEKLRENLENQKNQLIKAENTLEANLPTIISDFNLVSNRPGVRYFEGIKGMTKILEDNLKSNTDIYTFIDSQTLEQDKKFREIEKYYIEKRKQIGLLKKIIDIDSPQTREFYNNADADYKKITEVKFIKKGVNPFSAGIQIYDNKISYQIYNNNTLISVLIEDRNIYIMQKILFEYIWVNLK